MEIKFTLSDATVQLPYKATNGSAGYDVSANEERLIRPGDIVKIPTGISLELPSNTYAMLLGRSGLSTQGIWIHNGVIDSDYRGVVSFVVANIGKNSVQIRKGMRIGQLILMPILPTTYTLVQTLSESQLTVHGFGSTGY